VNKGVLLRGHDPLNFVRNFSVHFSIRELRREAENYSGQSFTVFIPVVWKSFIKKSTLMTKSNDRMSDFVNRHVSRPYNKAGLHLLLISCIMTSPEAILPILPNMQFAVRYNQLFVLRRNFIDACLC